MCPENSVTYLAGRTLAHFRSILRTRCYRFATIFDFRGAPDRLQTIDEALVACWYPVRVVGERRRRLRVAQLRGDVGDRRALGEQVRRERPREVKTPEPMLRL